MVDYGDRLRQSNETKRRLGGGADIEHGRCENAAFSEEYGRGGQGQPSSPPIAKLVEFAAQIHIAEEISAAKSALSRYSTPGTRISMEMRSISHEPPSFGHVADSMSLNHGFFFGGGGAGSDRGNFAISALGVSSNLLSVTAHAFNFGI